MEFDAQTSKSSLSEGVSGNLSVLSQLHVALSVLAGVDAGMLLYSAMGQKDPTVDMFSSLLVEFQRLKAAAEERREKNEAAAELRHWKA